jgi:hypothetical protein
MKHLARPLKDRTTGTPDHVGEAHPRLGEGAQQCIRQARHVNRHSLSSN